MLIAILLPSCAGAQSGSVGGSPVTDVYGLLPEPSAGAGVADETDGNETELDILPEQPPLSAGVHSEAADDRMQSALAVAGSGAANDDWLYASGNRLVDRDGKEVWVTGISWFGYNTGTNTFDGLWTANLEDALQAIADRGFNLLRIPFSVELILAWSRGEYPQAVINADANPALAGLNSLEIFDYAMELCAGAGLKVMIDIHSLHSDPSGHLYPLWYDEEISADDFYRALEWMAARFRGDDTVLMFDLKNEPHGTPETQGYARWDGSSDPDNWRLAAETAALRVLDANPDVLVVVQGVETCQVSEREYRTGWWGGNLAGVGAYPVNLGRHQNKLVYSPHDYGPSLYKQPWFHDGYTFETLYAEYWKDSWMFIHEQQIAPLIIGEWGGSIMSSDLQWMTFLRELIRKNRLNHIFWCYNPNSADTGGLVYDDFVTWDEEKYAFLREVLWQEDGKFVGLDHEVPLGANGLALQ